MQGACQRFALPALGRAAERRPTGKMLRRRKMLGIAPESPASGARFVGLLFALQRYNVCMLILPFRLSGNTLSHNLWNICQFECWGEIFAATT